MLPLVRSRSGGVALVLVVLVLAGATASCGSSGDPKAKDMVLLEFLFVDRALEPTAPTGTENLPRNAQVLMVFSEKVAPDSANDQTIRFRYGPSGQSVPKGAFSVDGNVVHFDPTLTSQGQPNPFGFEPITQYLVEIPAVGEQAAVVHNLDDDPNLESFRTTFVTSEGYLRELDPPEVVQVYSVPDRFEVNPLTGHWPGNAILAIEFSEPMDPASFRQGGAGGPDEDTAIDIRYVSWAQVNVDNDVAGRPIPGRFTHDAAATTWFFEPLFSFGDEKLVFAVQLFQGLKDLSGNQLVNPRSFGPYTCDGTGIATGITLEEEFETSTDHDPAGSQGADWGQSESGVLQGQEITSRDVYLLGYTFQSLTDMNKVGEYRAVLTPMVGAALNQYVSNVTPPTALGRRVMQALSDQEMGSRGSVTAAGWGPDSNATFAAIYPTIRLRCGFQKQASMTLSPSFSGNYDGNPVIVYSGPYQVPQAQNIGNTVDSGGDPGGYSVGPGCTVTPGSTYNSPLWDNTGFQPWPAFTTYFEWSPGEPGVPGDSVFLFDASVDEGDTWQQARAWIATTYPCSTVTIPGFPTRRLIGTFEADDANPPTNAGAGIFNPSPSVSDAAFTITQRVSLAQSRFYTDGLQPGNSVATTFGAASDYLPAVLEPSVQSGGAQVRIEYQGAHACEADRISPNVGPGPATPWTEDVNDCDGYECIRWRIWLVSNLISNQRARVDRVVLPIIDGNSP